VKLSRTSQKIQENPQSKFRQTFPINVKAPTKKIQFSYNRLAIIKGNKDFIKNYNIAQVF
jgi:hypothetical protein